MVRVIMDDTGSGKTKQLIDLANANGNAFLAVKHIHCYFFIEVITDIAIDNI